MARDTEKRERRGARGDVRQRILEAALAVLREGGVGALTQARVARRAGVRQSHLTYYFPRRPDLVSETIRRVTGAMAGRVGGALAQGGRDGAATLGELLEAVEAPEHMRMFVGAIVEGDRDPDVRAILVRETRAFEEALAAAFAGDDARERARVALAALWGLGLHAFVTGSAARGAERDALLAHLARRPTR
jgi:AcrR family transcriptional regulator